MKKTVPSAFKRKRLASLVALSLSLNATHLAAQEAEEADETQSLEKITVTAQKRTQSLQEVPVAVTAFSGEAMSESVIKDLYDLSSVAPALQAFQSQSATNSSFSIRGIGTSSQNFGLESSVGLYVDGVYRARQNSMINNMVDVEAVEVLRGPQGTLFGKNTPSGAILVRTVAPSHDGGDGFVEATVGNYGLLNFSGAASFSAIEDVLAFRVTGFSSDRDGFVDDVNLGDDIMNDRSRFGGRVQALYTPSDDLSVRIIADYSEIDEVCCAALTDLSNFQATDIPGKFGTDAFLSQPPFNADVFDGDDFFDYKTAVNSLPESTMKDRGISAEIDYRINDNMNFVSISAYRAFESFDFIDTDFSNAALFTTTNDAEQSNFSQEFRIDYAGDKLNYILGAYYFTQDLDLDYSLATDQLFNEFFLAGTGGALDPIINGINGLSAVTGGLIAPTATAAPADTGFNHVAEQEHESWAVFGQFDYQLTDTLLLTAGLRYSDETKDLNTVYTEVGPGIDGLDPALAPNPLATGAALVSIGTDLAMGLPPAPGDLAQLVPFQTPGWGFFLLGGPTTLPRPNTDVTLDDSQVTGTIKLSWQPDSNSLYYASYGTGYKSGGTNTDRIDAAFDPVFDAENSSAFEIGMKKDFPEQNLRINAAAHYTDVEDFQANTFTGNGFNLQNAGDIETYGIELETTWLPTDTMEINFVYAHTKAEFKTFERGNCWVAYPWHTGIDDPGRQNPDDRFCSRSGDRLGSEPEDYFSVRVKQDIDFGDEYYSYFLAEYSYTGDMPLDSSNDPFKFQDAYGLLNLRFFVNFIDYDLDVILWGRNVTGEEYINGSVFDVPIQDGKIMGYASEPATYGLTVKKRF